MKKATKKKKQQRTSNNWKPDINNKNIQHKKCVMLIMKNGKKKRELNCQLKKISDRLNRRKITNPWEYWKLTSLNKVR